jgi:transposase
MQVLHERCCGLDVHQNTGSACVLLPGADGAVQRRLRTVGTMTADLVALSDWLTDLGVTQIALESTGVYWRPVFNVLEADGRTITLVNPPHMKAVPGRKTDLKDSEWLAALLRSGLVQASFIPPVPVRELRELTRYRKPLVQQRTQEVNRLHKVLEGANLKRAAVASAILGKSGREMLAARLGGEEDPAVLAELARGRLREKVPALRQALAGRVKPYHRVLISQILAHSDFRDGAIAQLHDEIAAARATFQEAVALLQTIPGIGAVAAAASVAEIGADLGRFASAKHLARWAGICPGNKQSGGKRLSAKTTGGNGWLKATLADIAWANARRQEGYLGAQFRRLARRRGPDQALVAVAHSVLVIIYHVLRTRQPYHDLGTDDFEKLDTQRLEQLHVRRLNALGYQVTLTPLPATPASVPA